MFRNTVSPTAELYAVARAGNFSGVKILLDKYKDQGLKPDRGTLLAAIKSGNLDLVKYFKEEYQLVPKSGIMEATDEARSLELVKYLIKEYPSLRWTVDNTITWAAARTGDVKFLKYFLEGEFHVRPDEGTLYDAVRGGSLDMVKLLTQHYGITNVWEAHQLAKETGKNDIDAYFQAFLEAEQKSTMRY